MCVLQLPLSGCAVAPDGAPRAHRASPRAPPARRRAAALLGEMVPGEWSETEDSDAVAADFEEPQQGLGYTRVKCFHPSIHIYNNV